jgi:hypothetical protein
MASLYEGKQDEHHLLRIICACGIEGATLLYKKPSDRAKTIWAACDGWALTNGKGITQ